MPRDQRFDGVGPARASRIALMLTVLAAALAPVAAGTLSVSWNAVPDTDLGGYKVYYGTTPGSHAQFYDAGNTTSATLTGVSDCTIYYVAVRAYDTAKLESAADSNTVKGFPRPIVSSVASNTIKQGETKTFTVSGTNFDAGVSGDASRPAARVKLGNPGLTVTASSVTACGTLSVTVRASTTAATGWSSLTVENPDLTFTDPAARKWVYGTLDQGIQVTAATDTTAPTVTSTNPAAGATDVATSVQPTVTFSESMLASSITSQTVLLLDSTGGIVPQKGGSPSLSGAVATILPANPLAQGKTYQLRVKGGSTGVKDLAGNTMVSDWTQSPGFTTAGTAANPVAVTGSDPSPGQTGVPVTYRTIKIHYNRDISVLWNSLTRAELQILFRVAQGGRPLYQATTSPVHENGGKTVVITVRNNLAAGTHYRAEVGPISQKGRAALENAGIPVGVLAKLWRSDPAWQTVVAVESATSRTSPSAPGQSLEIPDDPSQVPEQNTDVPVASEFTVTFTQPVVPERLSSSVFRIVASNGTEVRQGSRPRLENGGRTVVLTPADPLDNGMTYSIVVRGGPAGVLLTQPDGSMAPMGNSDVTIPLATEVSGSSQSSTLSVEP